MIHSRLKYLNIPQYQSDILDIYYQYQDRKIDEVILPLIVINIMSILKNMLIDNKKKSLIVVIILETLIDETFDDETLKLSMKLLIPTLIQSCYDLNKKKFKNNSSICICQ
jgi:hypothetical protein